VIALGFEQSVWWLLCCQVGVVGQCVGLEQAESHAVFSRMGKWEDLDVHICRQDKGEVINVKLVACVLLLLLPPPPPPPTHRQVDCAAGC
jgi:hypothetical protein